MTPNGNRNGSDVSRLLKSGWFLAWIIAAALCLGVLAVIPSLSGTLLSNTGTAGVPSWYNLTSAVFEAVYVTLTFFLVLLTYSLFRIATSANKSSERFHRISIMPVIVAELVKWKFFKNTSLSVEGFSLEVDVLNVGGGPGFNVSVDVGPEPDICGGYDEANGRAFFVGIARKGKRRVKLFTPCHLEGDLVRLTITYCDVYNTKLTTEQEAHVALGVTDELDIETGDIIKGVVGEILEDFVFVSTPKVTSDSREA